MHISLTASPNTFLIRNISIFSFVRSFIRSLAAAVAAEAAVAAVAAVAAMAAVAAVATRPARCRPEL